MRLFVFIAAVSFFLISSVRAEVPEADLMDFEERSLMKPLDTWFKPEVCAQNPGEYFYVSLGHRDVSIFKIKRSLYQRASISAWPVVTGTDGNLLKGQVKKTMGCPESPMPVTQIFMSAPEGTAHTGVSSNLFSLRLDGTQSHDAHLLKLRDSGKAKEVHEGLLYDAGMQSLNGVKQPVAYFLAKDKNDLQKSGGPTRARCVPHKDPETLMCVVIDAINKEAVYEAVLPTWPPKLQDIHKLHAEMTALVESLRVQ